MIKCGIIGTGNIGTDLLFKILKEKFIKPVIFVGRRRSSEGIKISEKLNIDNSCDGLDFFIHNKNFCDVVFDCTDAFSAFENNRVFQKQGIKNYSDESGLTVYIVGAFKEYDEAVKAKDGIKEQGLNDAFVISFKDGKRMPLDEAKKEVGQ